ncbi:uncharacterized protein Dsimw501_GD27678 [Drosophila simulans]|nr:uncharacterized protein Dsimw501_GD27678 [Drosophila simulans]
MSRESSGCIWPQVPLFSVRLRLIRCPSLEPVGSVSPQLSGNGNQEHITLTRVPKMGSVTLMCPAQAYPVPFFRARWQRWAETHVRRRFADGED